MSYKIILLKILDAIEYAGDKEKFAREFIFDTQIQAVINLHKTLSEDRQIQFGESLRKTNNEPQKIAGILGEYFTQEHMEKTFSQTAVSEIRGFLKTINKTLSDSQRQKTFEVLTHTK